jgi:hypothetical protein
MLNDEQGAGPVGEGNYVVKQGDCVESLAVTTGHFWQTLWNLPENAALKAARGSPNLLLPGDQLYVPEIRPIEVDAVTEERHRFVRKGVPSKLRLRIMQGNQPRGSEPYQLVIDGTASQGTTDTDGWIEINMPPDAQSGELVVGPDALTRQVFPLDLGGMDPITEITGVQKRLRNLGYPCDATGEIDDETRSALAMFQVSVDLEASGELDQTTRQTLKEAHGS